MIFRNRHFSETLLLTGSVLFFSSCTEPEAEEEEATVLTGVFEGFEEDEEAGFVDNDLDRGEISGSVILPLAVSEKCIKKYIFYWGNIRGEKVTETPLAVKTKTGLNQTLRLPDDTVVPATAVLIMVYVQDTGDAYSGGYDVLIEDRYSPSTTVTEISFTDTDNTYGELAGVVTMTPPTSTISLSSYLVYWGNSDEEIVSATALTEVTDVTEPAFTLPANTAIPEGATHFLVFGANEYSAAETPFSYAFTDKGIPRSLATAVTFTDSDVTAQELAGTLTIGRATDETEITHYVLYWGSALEDKLFSTPITTLSKTLSPLQYTIPANTPLPAEAVYFLVFTKNSTGEMNEAYSSLIVDD